MSVVEERDAELRSVLRRATAAVVPSSIDPVADVADRRRRRRQRRQASVAATVLVLVIGAGMCALVVTTSDDGTVVATDPAAGSGAGVDPQDGMPIAPGAMPTSVEDLPPLDRPLDLTSIQVGGGYVLASRPMEPSERTISTFTLDPDATAPPDESFIVPTRTSRFVRPDDESTRLTVTVVDTTTLPAAVVDVSWRSMESAGAEPEITSDGKAVLLVSDERALRIDRNSIVEILAGDGPPLDAELMRDALRSVAYEP